MITVNSMLGENSGTAEMELKGLSTDTKPTGSFSGKKLGENSLFIELDTGDIYYYHGGEWSIMSTGGGGGGSVTVDTEISNTSENPVQNKAIAAALANKKDNDFIINANFNENFVVSNFTNNGEAVSAADAVAAFNAGKQVYIIAAGTGAVEGTYCSLSMTQNAGGMLVFSGIGIIAEGNVPKWKIFSAMIVSFSEGTTLQIGDTLPLAINSDIGKILMVGSNRTYVLVDPSVLPIVPLVVHITGEEVEGVTVYTADKLIKSEIIPAVLAGRTVYADVDVGDFTIRASLSAYDNTNNECMVGLCATIPDTGSSSTETFGIYGAGYLIDGVEHDNWTPILPN